VVTGSGQGLVGILLGAGNGALPQALTYAVGYQPYAVAVGDFNGDGKPDLAVANNVSDDVSILLGNGDGTFQPQVKYAAGTGPSSLAIGDFSLTASKACKPS
jgi:hypothetical protein